MVEVMRLSSLLPRKENQLIRGGEQQYIGIFIQEVVENFGTDGTGTFIPANKTIIIRTLLKKANTTEE